MMHAAGDDNDAVRLRALIVVLWRAGLRISEALALTESDLDVHRGAILVRRGKGGKRREVGIDRWAWEQLTPWLQLHPHLAPQWVSRGRPLTRASHPAMSSPGCLPRQPSGHERARLVGAREARRSHTCSRERVKLSGPHSRLFRRRARPPIGGPTKPGPVLAAGSDPHLGNRRDARVRPLAQRPGPHR